MCSGSPALPPGVSTRTAVPAQYAASSGSPICHSASAARRLSASSCARAAKSSGLGPSRCGSDSRSTQGSSDADSKPGKASSRLGKSPLTSITTVGTCARAASSIITVTRPVFPLPVMPTTTP